MHVPITVCTHVCTSRLSAKKCASFEVRKVHEIAALFILFHCLAFPLFLIKKIRSGLHYFGEKKLCIENLEYEKVHPTQMLEVAR